MHHQPSNKGWILAGGVHVVYMVSLLILSLVYAMFEPAPDWFGDDSGFGDWEGYDDVYDEEIGKEFFI